MKPAWQLERFAAAEGLEAWQLHVGAMPLDTADRAALAAVYLRLLKSLAAHYRLNETVWLEATHIHEEGATEMLGQNARIWGPKTGFGVFPDGEAPRLWTKDDFSGAPFGHQVPLFNNQVFEISRAEGHTSAVQAMAGRGVLSMLLLSRTAEEFKRESTAMLSPLVKEQAFHAYSYFFPLLSERSVSNPETLQWMGSATVYMRELKQEKAMLVLSRVPLEAALPSAGAVRTQDGHWLMAAEEAR